MSASPTDVQATTTGTELTLQERAVAALGFIDITKELEKLGELAGRTKTITSITNFAGYEQVHAGRMVLVRRRVELQKLGKVARDDATKFSKKIIELEKQCIEVIEPEEKRLQGLQDAHDAEVERRKAEEAAKERERVQALQRRVESIRNMTGGMTLHSAADVAEQLEEARALVIDESFQEFQEAAKAAASATVLTLVKIHEERVAYELEQANLKAAREALARITAEQEERARVERERIAAEEQQAREQREAEDAERLRVQQAREAELQRQRDENERIAREQQQEIDRQRAAADAAAQEAQRKLDEQAEAQRAEAQRLADQEAELQRRQEIAQRQETLRQMPAPTAVENLDALDEVLEDANSPTAASSGNSTWVARQGGFFERFLHAENVECQAGVYAEVSMYHDFIELSVEGQSVTLAVRGARKLRDWLDKVIPVQRHPEEPYERIVDQNERDAFDAGVKTQGEL